MVERGDSSVGLGYELEAKTKVFEMRNIIVNNIFFSMLFLIKVVVKP